MNLIHRFLNFLPQSQQGVVSGNHVVCWIQFSWFKWTSNVFLDTVQNHDHQRFKQVFCKEPTYYLHERRLRTNHYDNRDYFNVPIVNFPVICNNSLTAPAYRVNISQFIRYSRDYGSYQGFLHRELLLTRQLLNQGFLLAKLKSSLRTFYCRHHDLVGRYGISVSQMTTDMFYLS